MSIHQLLKSIAKLEVVVHLQHHDKLVILGPVGVEKLAHAVAIRALVLVAEAVEVALDVAPDDELVGGRSRLVLGCEVLVGLWKYAELAVVKAWGLVLLVLELGRRESDWR